MQESIRNRCTKVYNVVLAFADVVCVHITSRRLVGPDEHGRNSIIVLTDMQSS